jgi:PHD/YefM family antitoxin component YafN of YafNO toxin-antitoxin module
MKNTNFDRLLKFAQKTGDRLIVTDADGQDPIVILSLSEYEALLETKAKTKTIADALVAKNEKFTTPHVETSLSDQFDFEPDMIPIKPADETPINAEPEPSAQEAAQAPAPEGNEEQFYLEPI